MAFKKNFHFSPLHTTLPKETTAMVGEGKGHFSGLQTGWGFILLVRNVKA